jgi:ureidoglycolate dehydrogenase (NAD+)
LFVQAVCERAGLGVDEAAQCAEASIFADLRGSDTHGIIYVIPRTLESIRSGRTLAGAKPVVVRDNGAALLLKGNGAAGPVLGREAMRLAIARAKEQGVGVVNTANGNPLGLLGYYPALAADDGLVGLIMANTPPAAAPWGSSSRVFGTNPFAYAVPAGDEPAIIFDVATTAAAAGKLMRAKRRGEQLPPGWVIDEQGEPVLDPAAADNGAMLPFGGHKGSAISLLIHMLTGALAGTTVGGEPTHQHPDPERRGQSALYLAFDPDRFGSREEFRQLVDKQIEIIHNATPLPGVDKVLVPGERGWREAERRRLEGIPIAVEDWEAVIDSIRSFGLDLDALLASCGPDIVA